ncbi:MAG: HEPN domain-containing protein, partial [Candidatus Methylomirabilales bacterium]
MTRDVEKLMEKGRRSFAAAEQLFKSGDYDFSASRAYYAMFYLAEAGLLAKGLAFSKHSRVISAFSEHLVKAG